MLRTLTIATLMLAAAAAGCITPPSDIEEAATLPAPEPGGKLTAGPAREDTQVAPCTFPPLSIGGDSVYCATRTISVAGELTLSALVALIDAGAADLVVEPSSPGEWDATAIIEHAAESEAAAREGTTHYALAIDVGTEQAPVLNIDFGPTSTEASGSTTLVVRLPTATLYELTIDMGSGDCALSGLSTVNTILDVGSGDTAIGDGFSARGLAIDAGSGAVMLDIDVVSATIDGGSGDITGTLRPTASGAIVVSAGSGDVDILVPEDARHGYDVVVNVGSGGAEITLEDGDLSTSENGATFATTNYGKRAIRTTMQVSTGSGDSSVGAA